MTYFDSPYKECAGMIHLSLSTLVFFSFQVEKWNLNIIWFVMFVIVYETVLFQKKKETLWCTLMSLCSCIGIIGLVDDWSNNLITLEWESRHNELHFYKF